MFEYRNQPLKSLFLLYSGVTILFIRLPYWLIRFSIPSFRQRRNWPLSRAVAVPLIDTLVRTLYGISGTDDIQPEKNEKKQKELGFVWVEPVGEEWVRGDIKEMAEVNGVKTEKRWGYWFGKRDEQGKHGQKAARGERVLYHLHGGGYTRGSGSPKSETAAIPNGVLEQCAGFVDRAFCIDYRLASSAPFEAKNHYPAQILDCLAGYLYLINDLGFSPSDIIVSGDSAGGHLAIALVRYIGELKDHRCPLPGSTLLFSPTTDWGCTHDEKPDSSMNVNIDSDFVSAVLKGGYTAESLRGNLPKDQIITNAWLSPASLKLSNYEGLFSKFPKTCIVVGGAEQTRDGMRTFKERLVKDTSAENVRYLEYEDAVHDFIGLPFHEPERGLALKEIHKWLKEELGRPDSPV